MDTAKGPDIQAGGGLLLDGGQPELFLGAYDYNEVSHLKAILAPGGPFYMPIIVLFSVANILLDLNP